MVPLLLGLLTGAAVALALAPGARPGAVTSLQRLYARLGAPTPAPAAAKSRRPWVRQLPLGSLVALVQPCLSPVYKERTQQRLQIARLAATYTAADIVAMKLAAVLGGGLYAALLAVKEGSAWLAAVLAAMVLLAFVWPDAWLAGKARRRQEQIRRSLPAMLSALAVALEAGLGPMAALGEVSRQRQGPLAEELRQAVELYQRGLSPAAALESVTRRLEVAELTVALSGLVQSFQKGSGQVVSTVRAQAAEAWQKRRRQAEALAQTASVKLFLPLALLALPGALVFLLGPAVLQMLEFLR